MAEHITLQKRTIDEMITHFNKTVADMDIKVADKMTILGMITAIGYQSAHEHADFRDCRNELCLRCGQYKTKHLGSCNGCRWEH